MELANITVGIRVDAATNQGAVYDVIKLVNPDANASQTFGRLPNDVITKCPRLKINGAGQLTPVADARTLVEIVWLLPGEVARKLRRTSAQTVCRALGGDLTLVAEIEARRTTLASSEEGQQAARFLVEPAAAGAGGEAMEDGEDGAEGHEVAVARTGGSMVALHQPVSFQQLTPAERTEIVSIYREHCRSTLELDLRMKKQADEQELRNKQEAAEQELRIKQEAAKQELRMKQEAAQRQKEAEEHALRNKQKAAEQELRTKQEAAQRQKEAEEHALKMKKEGDQRQKEFEELKLQLKKQELEQQEAEFLAKQKTDEFDHRVKRKLDAETVREKKLGNLFQASKNLKLDKKLMHEQGRKAFEDEEEMAYVDQSNDEDPGFTVPTPECRPRWRGEPINVGQVAAKLNLATNDKAARVSAAIVRLYRNRYGAPAAEKIPKKKIYFDGQIVEVQNIYYKRDEDLIEAAIREVTATQTVPTHAVVEARAVVSGK